MKKKIHIDGIIISLYDLPLISDNNVIGDFENSYYNIACIASPCLYQYHRQLNNALLLQSRFNLKACFRHFFYAVWMLDGFLLYFDLKDILYLSFLYDWEWGNEAVAKRYWKPVCIVSGRNRNRTFYNLSWEHNLMRDKIIRIKWNNALLLDEAIESELSNTFGSISSACLILGTLIVCGPTPWTASRCSACIKIPANS